MTTEEDLIEAATRIGREGVGLHDVILPEDLLVELVGRERADELLASGRARVLEVPDDTSTHGSGLAVAPVKRGTARESGSPRGDVDRSHPVDTSMRAVLDARVRGFFRANPSHDWSRALDDDAVECTKCPARVHGEVIKQGVPELPPCPGRAR